MDLFRRLARYRREIFAVLILQLVTTLATLYLPDLNADIIDNGVARADVPYIWNVGLRMLIVALIQIVAAIGAVWFASQVAMKTGRDIRAAVYDRVSGFTSEDMARFGTATLVTRGTNDVQQVQMTFLLFMNFMVAAPIMAIGGIIMALRQDAGMSWLVVTAVVVLAVVVGVIVAILMPLFKQMQKRLDAINVLLREQIAGIRVVRAFAREDYETERFTDANQQITKLSLNIGRVFVTMFPVIMLILNLATAAVLWFGGHRVDEGLVEVGALTAFMQYLMQILMAVMMGVFMLMMLPRAIVCARRVAEVLGHAPQIVEPARPTSPTARTGEVEFRDVTFTYPGADAPVLKRVSFTARPGTTTAIIGATGSGKTTLLSLIPRLHVATEGQVLLDATPIDNLARPDIVERVSMVPQKPWLFSGTVASNLRMGNPDATDEELWNALRAAQADFVDDLDMEISQGGTNVSGGQRQRLSIARMLVAQPDVFLFDDSFSALDASTDARVRAAMTEYTAGKVVIVVGQRVASISGADQILVMEAGEIVARGTHEELLESSQTYREIEQSQKAVQA
ncbi:MULTISPECIES: ABC transporter ATP-binding protein [Corynebacterium]|uniref:ABC transporter ATP-binding protein n=1 Tax=Corynebacterium gottingense TaxID=2041036 RepID=A0ABX9UJ38_9CORY|nr:MULTISPECIES: ABC transporter ATP-binding protein [Corynebacterium]PAT12777.1 multidrug ABC transporter ATP-binding protein [Corynebacterium hadale]RMD19087.1 ABC transporter ATP-binding protein [Corynebacterium gottingense]WJZ14016.1 putative ABC transporter ATP-binding protein [Corynebacterium gottingense]WJZ16331.1 putative ABC transporter ATP-binding protein [Corynebacterium gottingense]